MQSTNPGVERCTLPSKQQGINTELETVFIPCCQSTNLGAERKDVLC